VCRYLRKTSSRRVYLFYPTKEISLEIPGQLFRMLKLPFNLVVLDSSPGANASGIYIYVPLI